MASDATVQNAVQLLSDQLHKITTVLERIALALERQALPTMLSHKSDPPGVCPSDRPWPRTRPRLRRDCHTIRPRVEGRQMASDATVQSAVQLLSVQLHKITTVLERIALALERQAPPTML